MPLSVLVVDDDPHVRELLKELFEQAGHEVRTAEDGMQAVQFAVESPPDLVVTDLDMPAGSGDAVFRRLRAGEGTKDVPIVFLTGLPEREARLKLPVVPDRAALLRKPVRWRELEAAIKKLTGLP